MHGLDLVHDSIDLIDECAQDGIRALLARLQSCNAGRQIAVGGDEFANAYKSPADYDVHLDRAFAFQNRRKHGHAMLGEDVRACTPAATAFL